jgi:hypothetical protein
MPPSTMSPDAFLAWEALPSRNDQSCPATELNQGIATMGLGLTLELRRPLGSLRLRHEVSQSPQHDPNPLDDVCSALGLDHTDFVFFFVLDWAAERRRCCRSPGRIARPGHPFSLRGTAVEVCETTCQIGLRWRA